MAVQSCNQFIPFTNQKHGLSKRGPMSPNATESAVEPGAPAPRSLFNEGLPSRSRRGWLVRSKALFGAVFRDQEAMFPIGRVIEPTREGERELVMTVDDATTEQLGLPVDQGTCCALGARTQSGNLAAMTGESAAAGRNKSRTHSGYQTILIYPGPEVPPTRSQSPVTALVTE